VGIRRSKKTRSPTPGPFPAPQADPCTTLFLVEKGSALLRRGPSPVLQADPCTTLLCLSHSPRCIDGWHSYRRGGWNALKAKALAGQPPNIPTTGGTSIALFINVIRENPVTSGPIVRQSCRDAAVNLYYWRKSGVASSCC
jgi:hypothetical protein